MPVWRNNPANSDLQKKPCVLVLSEPIMMDPNLTQGRGE